MTTRTFSNKKLTLFALPFFLLTLSMAVPFIATNATAATVTSGNTLTQASTGLVFRDPLTASNNTISSYWTLAGDAVGEGIPYSTQENSSGLYIGIHTPNGSANSEWAGFYAESPNSNVMLFHTTLTLPYSTLPSGSFNTGLYVQTANGLINYIACAAAVDHTGYSWSVVLTQGNTQQATSFTVLYSQAGGPLTQSCTIVTNGSNMAQVYLANKLVFSSTTMTLNMPEPFNSYIEVEASSANANLFGKYTDYYATLNDNLVVQNVPSGYTVELVGPASNVLATTTATSTDSVTLQNLGVYDMPIAASLEVFDASQNLVATTGNSFWGGDIYTLNLSTQTTSTSTSPTTTTLSTSSPSTVTVTATSTVTAPATTQTVTSTVTSSGPTTTQTTTATVTTPGPTTTQTTTVTGTKTQTNTVTSTITTPGPTTTVTRTGPTTTTTRTTTAPPVTTTVTTTATPTVTVTATTTKTASGPTTTVTQTGSATTTTVIVTQTATPTTVTTTATHTLTGPTTTVTQTGTVTTTVTTPGPTTTATSTVTSTAPGQTTTQTVTQTMTVTVTTATSSHQTTSTTTTTSTAPTTTTTTTTVGGPASVVVQSVNQNGQAITGYWTVLYNSAGTQLTTGFTPVTFSGLTAGTAYGVSVSSYGACTFSHWQDNGSTNAMRAFTAASTQTFTGVFNCTNATGAAASPMMASGSGPSALLASFVTGSSIVVGRSQMKKKTADS